MGMFNFTLRETIDLSTSVFALCLALTIASMPNGFMGMFGQPVMVMSNFILFFIIITPAFVLHEMGHRFTAMKYGAEAHYQGFPMWILFMLIGAILFGFVFAATGAVVIFARYLTPKENAEISLAGPKVNIILTIIFLILLLGLPFAKDMISENMYNIASTVFSYSAFINAFLATFNLVPIWPLDGSKILPYSFPMWGMWFGISLILLVIIKPEMLTFILFLVLLSLLLSSINRRVKIR
ncbi:site-2 protease family protein [Candidatus Micrarchaeota archaeon]|nr:site-2 protease family protein [Candidatus Micrarchaeota archaeon]